MTAFHPLVPSKAIEMIEAAGIPHAQRLIRDHAAAGLVKSYAMLIETTEVSGATTCIRGAAMSIDLWRRIVTEDADEDVWTGGTVRLAPSGLIGGVPAVNITGVGFNGSDLQRLIDQHCGGTSKGKRPQLVGAQSDDDADVPAPAIPKPTRRQADLLAIPPGALAVTVNQAMAALGLGRTKVNDLMVRGTLVRVKIDTRTLITTESIRALTQVAG